MAGRVESRERDKLNKQKQTRISISLVLRNAQTKYGPHNTHLDLHSTSSPFGSAAATCTRTVGFGEVILIALLNQLHLVKVRAGIVFG